MKILTVSDLHQSRRLYDELSAAVRMHTPHLVAVVGDTLDMDDAGGRELSFHECAERLRSLPAEVVFVRGNHDSGNWLGFRRVWRTGRNPRPLHALHAEAFKFSPLIMAGFPCRLGDEKHYVAGRKPMHPDWLARAQRAYGDAMRTLWLMHEPPSGTRLSEEAGPMAGRIEWLAAIARYSPLLVIAGHDHRTPLRHSCWHERVHDTQVINVGQRLDGPLHYTVIEMQFPKTTPCLPRYIQVTAYPWQQSIEIGNRDWRTTEPR
jgi:Icc-related predicted phosphoesterase